MAGMARKLRHRKAKRQPIKILGKYTLWEVLVAVLGAVIVVLILSAVIVALVGS
jgi:hypothetical protein